MTNKEYIQANKISVQDAYDYFDATQKAADFWTWLDQKHISEKYGEETTDVNGVRI